MQGQDSPKGGRRKRRDRKDEKLRREKIQKEQKSRQQVHLLRGPTSFRSFFHLLKVFSFFVVHYMDSMDYNTGYLIAAMVDTLPAEVD